MTLPNESLLTFASGAGSYAVYVNTVTQDFDFLNFDRLEFSNQKLRAAPNALGGLPIIQVNYANLPIQLSSNCAGDSPRPLTPDDANIYTIKQRFNITRFTIQTAPNLSSTMDAIYIMYKNHKKLLGIFDLYLQQLQMDISYNALVAMQANTFSYLTSTSLNVSGNAIGGTASSLLITNYSNSVEYEVSLPGSGYTLLKSATITLENRVVVSQNSLV